MHRLSVRNLSDRPMPAGLGFHPYFPRRDDTSYFGRHGGEWHTAGDGLPLKLCEAQQPVDWWHGEPVGSRSVDTVYDGREGDIVIAWPDRRLGMTIQPSADLPCTVVFTPPEADYFCVEPVSHATDAINRSRQDDAMRVLDHGEAMSVEVQYRASRLDG